MDCTLDRVGSTINLCKRTNKIFTTGSSSFPFFFAGRYLCKGSKVSMECSTAVVFSQLSFLPSRLQTETRAYPFKPWKQRTGQSTRFQCHKMYVPGFGTSPESTAAQHLHHFFNFIAVKIVAAQLQSYNPEAYQELREFLDRNPLNDGDKFCADLMRESPRHKNLALRILEVRSAYCKDDFEWDNLKRLASKMVDDSNKKLMTDYIVDTSCIADGKQICN